MPFHPHGPGLPRELAYTEEKRGVQGYEGKERVDHIWRQIRLWDFKNELQIKYSNLPTFFFFNTVKGTFFSALARLHIWFASINI